MLGAVLSIRAGSQPKQLATGQTLNFDTKLKIMERSRKNIVRHLFQMTDWKTQKIAFPSI